MSMIVKKIDRNTELLEIPVFKMYRTRNQQRKVRSNRRKVNRV